MKVKMVRDYTHTIVPGRLQSFKAGRSYNPPAATAQEMIKAGAAIATAKPKPTLKPEEEDKANG